MTTSSGIEKTAVLIAGIGMTPVGEHWEKSLRQLALEAIHIARAEAGGLVPQALYVANMLAPLLSGQSHLGTLVADFAGSRGMEATTVEAAGASGGMALRQAYLALSSGMVEVAMVVGVEKVTDKVGRALNAALATAADADFESAQGVTPAAQAALLMRRYLHEHQAPPDALAGFSLTAHANAVHNPRAMFRRAITAEQYNQAGMVCDPLNMFDAAPIADGAAALVLARADAVPRHSSLRRVQVLASAAATSALALHEQSDPLTLAAAHSSALRAYEQAHVTPDDIHLFEVHDVFTIYAALALEAAGFAKRGEGWKLAQGGEIALQGRIPICTFGGSKARGDVVGATGVYQVAEVTLQLQGRGNASQVKEARLGMAQCLGGTGGTAVTHILAQADEA